jgi:prevent-host-death family protein
MNIGIRELKQGLSECLDRVARGEIVTVTDRGRPKALIIPVPGNGEFERGIDEGWIREPSRVGLVPFQRVIGRASIASTLDDDRSDP